jgi:branched-subunit amino acid ABC-type transport system permease component
LALYLQGVALINFGNSFPQPRSVVPDEAIDNFLGLGKVFPRNTIYVVGFAVLMGLLVWAAYRYTRFGLATRAAAGNEKGAVLLGYSPQTLAAVNWVIASVLATLAVIVVGPIAGTITPVGLTALIVPALAAALIGGLRSIPIAVAGGLALGAVQTLLDVEKANWFDGNLDWMQTGVRNFLPLVVIIVVLYVRGKSLPIRGAVEEKRLPIAPEPRRVFEHAFVWVTVLTLLAFVFEDSGGRTRFANSIQTGLVISIVMLSIVLLTGYTGQISLAQMSFAGIAAFITARMMADGIGRGSNLVPVEGPGLAWPIADVAIQYINRHRHRIALYQTDTSQHMAFRLQNDLWVRLHFYSWNGDTLQPTDVAMIMQMIDSILLNNRNTYYEPINLVLPSE